MTRADSWRAGFSLLEVMVAMTVMLLVLAGTLTAMTNAMGTERTAREMPDMNGHLRASMDLVVRDLLQVGQGLPARSPMGVPNGPGAGAIVGRARARRACAGARHVRRRTDVCPR